MIKGFEKSQFSSDAMDGKPAAYDVYTKGEGPVVVVIQELPGYRNGDHRSCKPVGG